MPKPALIVAICLLGLLAGLAACSGKISTSSIETVDASTLAKWIERSPNKYMIIDARRSEALNDGRLPGATTMSIEDVDPQSPDPALRRPSALVVYGTNPGSLRAEAMTKRLMTARVNKVYLLDGGFEAWQSRGLPVER